MKKDRLEKMQSLVKRLDKSLNRGKITLSEVEEALSRHKKNLEWLIDGIRNGN